MIIEGRKPQAGSDYGAETWPRRVILWARDSYKARLPELTLSA